MKSRLIALALIISVLISELSVRTIMAYSENNTKNSLQILETAEAKVTEESDVEEKDIQETEASEVTLEQPTLVANLEDTDTENEYVTVTINYLDAADGNSLFGSYTAQLLKESQFTETVLSPTWLGYTPVYNKKDRAAAYDKYTWDCNDDEISGNENDDIVSAKQIDFDEKVEENITVNVYYIPALVPYTVQYFIQNLNDDLYTEDYSLYWSGTALTGTIVDTSVFTDKVSAATEGFTMLYHTPESVAADGSTAFECYFDRNYYLVNFDLDGGYGQDPIYARYESPIVPATPTNPGYTFDGWLVYKDSNDNGIIDDDDILIDQPTTVPAYNLIFKAKWKKSSNPEVTYIYWLQNANDDEYSYWGSVTATNLSVGDTASGASWMADTSSTKVSIGGVSTTITDKTASKLGFENAAYTTYNKTKTEAEAEQTVLGDGSTTVNIYYDRNDYTLRFYFAIKDGSTIKVSSSTNGTLANSYNSTISISVTFDLTSDGINIAKSRVVGNVTYYYFDLTARFGADISNSWPSNGYLGGESVDGWRSGSDFSFLTWGSNTATGYYDSHDNKNIKGVYETLDASIIESKDLDGDDEDIDGDGVTDSITGFYAYNGQSSNNTNLRKYIFEYWLKDTASGEYELQRAETVKVTANPTNMSPSAITGYTKNSQSYLKYDTTSSTWVTSNGSESESKNTSGAYEKVLFDGTSYEDTDINQVIRFYFDPNNYNLNFYSNGSFLSFELPYGETIEEYFNSLITDGKFIESNGNKIYYSDLVEMGTNYYPSTLEPGAYTFEGWYTNQLYTADSKIDLSSTTMPARDSQIYAYWKPVSYKVEFYYDYSKLTDGEILTDDDGKEMIYTVTHGSSLGSSGITVLDQENQIITDSSGKSLTLYFNGWFYMDNGVKTAINLESTLIKNNLRIYADWTSNVAQPYMIQYKIQGEDTEIAAPLKGYGYQAATRTFTAKVGNSSENSSDGQLYDGYNVGYFPTVASHSMVIMAEEDVNNPVYNTYTFEYVNLTEPIEYTVRYVNKLDGTILASEQKKSTLYNLVTERFVAVSGYIPDAFYKQLTLSVEWDEASGKWVSSSENVITFYYTQSETTAFYAVHYMMQTVESAKSETTPKLTIGSNDFSEVSRVEAVADLGTIKVTPLNFTGFTKKGALTTTNNGLNSSTLSANSDGTYTIQIKTEGTELYVFYLRNTYSYKVELRKYYSEGNDDDLLGSIIIGDDNDETRGIFGESVSVSNSQIESWMNDKSTKWTKVPDLGNYVPINGSTAVESTIIRADEENPKNNIIIIYYTLKSYTIEYVTGVGGTVSREQITITTADGDYGSTPTADSGYKFEGWYTDEEYTTAVDTDKHTISNADSTITPGLIHLDTTVSNKFYAKFEEVFGNLTIERSNGDDNQTFVYKVENNDDSSICLYVSIAGNDSTTITGLRQGTYTVTQENGWSWRYEDNKKEVTVGENGATASFDDKVVTNKWLSWCGTIVTSINGNNSN